MHLSNPRRDAAPLLEEQELGSSNGGICKRFVIAQPAVLKPGQQRWVTVTSGATGSVIIERNWRLFDNHICLAATGVHQSSGLLFRILIANFGMTSIRLKSGQIVARVDELLTDVCSSQFHTQSCWVSCPMTEIKRHTNLIRGVSRRSWSASQVKAKPSPTKGKKRQ